MSKKTGKKKHTFFIVMAVILIILIAAALILMTHTQIIVSAIQSMSAATVNTKNLYEPLGTPMEGMKENGQYIITEIRYSDHFPNSYLDITYPDQNRTTSRPSAVSTNIISEMARVCQ